MGRELLEKLINLKNKMNVATFAAIFSAVAAIAAWYNAYQIRMIWEETNRPYITIGDKTGIFAKKSYPYYSPYTMEIAFENIGVNPASELELIIVMVDNNLKTLPDITGGSVANDIVKNHPATWSGGITIANEQKTNYFTYIFIAVTYKDSLTNRTFRHDYSFKHLGILYGEPSRLMHTSINEAKKIKEHLKKLPQLERFL